MRSTGGPILTFPSTKRGVPHISLVFREMWDTTASNRQTVNPYPHISWKYVVPNISRKTSETWDTLIRFSNEIKGTDREDSRPS